MEISRPKGELPLPGAGRQENVRSRLKVGRMAPLRDITAFVWILVAAFVALFYPHIRVGDWLTLHLVVLGALSHSILVWSEYFARTLLKIVESKRAARMANVRIVLLFFGGLAVMIGYPTSQWWLALAGAIVVSAAALFHARFFISGMRRALPARFCVAVWYYLVSALMLPVGASFGVILAFGVDQDFRARLILAHIATNVFGWIGLTLLGTLITFWPTIVRAPMHEASTRLARRAFPLLLAGIALVIAGALTALVWLALAGVVVYIAGCVHFAPMIARPAKAKGLREFSSASVAAGLVWAFGFLIALCVVLVRACVGEGAASASSGVYDVILDAFSPFALVIGAGVGMQIMLGALSYLFPTLLGGGPALVRASIEAMYRGAALRLIAANAGLLALLLPLPSAVLWACWLMVVASFASFVPLTFLTVKRYLAHRSALRADSSRRIHDI